MNEVVKFMGLHWEVLLYSNWPRTLLFEHAKSHDETVFVGILSVFEKTTCPTIK